MFVRRSYQSRLLKPQKIAGQLSNRGGPLACKSIRRNSCVEIGNARNCVSFVFTSVTSDAELHDSAADELIQACRNIAEDYLQVLFKKKYFTSSDPHHDMLGGGCQVRVVIENMMGRMENLRTLISGFLGLVILVRWALVTMFLS